MRAEGGMVVLSNLLTVSSRIEIYYKFFKVRSNFMEDLCLLGADWKGGY